MLRTAIRWGIVVAAAFAAPLVGGACFDDHTAEECQYTYSCPLPDAGDGGDANVDVTNNDGH